MFHSKILCLLFVLGFFNSSAQAYVPPSAYLIQQLTKKHAALKGLRVKTRITGTENQLKEIFWLDMATKTMKGRFLDASDQEIFAYERKFNESSSLTALVLFEKDPVRLARSLISNGIPVVPEDVLSKLPSDEERRAAEKTSIARLNGKVAWAIGKTSPNLWVLKDEFTALRLLYRGEGGEAEIRFEDTKVNREFPFARSITLMKGGDFVLKGEAMEVMVNPDLTDMKKIAVVGLPLIPSTVDHASKNLIENWIQWIR